ncbi:MAG: redoxin family protein [Flavisolibacter sp.]
MKRPALYILLGFSWPLLVNSQEKLQLLPAKPERGQEITIHYNPSAPGATISDTATAVEMVFTYSNLFEMPWRLPLEKKNGTWETHFKLPPYATYATFYLRNGETNDQPAADRHYAITVYENGKRVRNSYLYEGYSQSAQKGKVPLLAALQAALFQQELDHYPDNYEAQLRLLKNKMDATLDKKLQQQYRDQARAIIAKKFYENPGEMNLLNKVTMGYLIIGENSRLDSIRTVVKNNYPHTSAGYELIIGDILDSGDTTAMIAGLEKLLKEENTTNTDFLTDAHKALVKLYAAQKNEEKTLYHLRRSGKDTSPYAPETLQRTAATLLETGVALDTAYQLAKMAYEVAGQYPAGLIRYFPETGYLPEAVAPEKRAAVTQKARGNALAILSLIEWKRGHAEEAATLMQEALDASPDVKTLAYAGTYYANSKQYEKAFTAYRQIMWQTPEDTVSLAGMKTSYLHWKNDPKGWESEWQALNQRWHKEMMARLQQEIIRVQPHDYVSNVVDLQGRPVPAAAIKNKIVILDFWATWCVPCMHEMPYVQKAYEKFAGRDDVAFMVINSGAKNTLKDAQGWWGNKRYSFPVYFNTDAQVGEKLGFNLIPALYILDKEGFIRFKTIGFEGPSIQRKIVAAIELLSEE